MLSGFGPVTGRATSRLPPPLLMGEELPGRRHASQPVEERLQREVLEHVALEAARGAASASARCPAPAGDARYRARSALPPASRAQASAVRGSTPCSSSSSAIRAAGTGPKRTP